MSTAVVTGLILVLLALCFPAGSSGDGSAKALARNDVSQIANAVVLYQRDYGHLPPVKDGAVGGELLAVLTGSNSALNPKNVVYLEVEAATKNRSGMKDGSFVDPWGGVYQIALDRDADARLIVGTNGVEIKKMVGVWNDPNRGTDGASLSESEKRRRYVTSWE